MRAVDTNVLVRLITRDDAKQVAVAEAFVAKGAWVPHVAIAETTWVLASVYDRGPAAVATAVMAPPVALDPQGTRRVPRIPMADGTEILVDGGMSVRCD